MIPVPKLDAKSFRVVKTLGKGAYGEVVLARYELSSEAYVLFVYLLIVCHITTKINTVTQSKKSTRTQRKKSKS